MKDNIVRFLFITDQPVPQGLAGTNRLLSLAKGVVENGHRASILIVNPTEKKGKQKNNQKKGTIDSIGFQYLSPSVVIPSNILLKVLSFLYSSLHLLFKVIVTSKANLPDAIIMLHTWAIYPLVLWPFAKLRGIKLLQERNEYPFINIRNKGMLRRVDYFIYTHIVLRLFDGMVLMTKNLVMHYHRYVSRNCMMIHLPMTVDTTRFNLPAKPVMSCNYLAYTGYLYGDKDGVPDMLKAFARFVQTYKDYKLCVIGDNTNAIEFEKIKSLLVELTIEDKVIFTGRVERDEIPAYLQHAKLLLLARPDNIQAQGGFPTKLGEYLATGVPVVVTKVGEIPDYLSDGKNAFLAEPDSPESFAAKMMEAIDNYPFAIEVGENGRMVANNAFSHKVQGRKLIEAIQTLLINEKQ
jgi:glycosyltransferase involved in cell wall biosynthesis